MAGNINVSAIIRFLLFGLIVCLPYSKAIIETCVILSLVLWFSVRLKLLVHPKGPDRQGGASRSWGDVIKPPPTPLNTAILFFVIICLCSAVFSINPAKSFHGFITKTLEWFAVFYLMVGVFTTKRQLATAVVLYLATSCVTCLDGIVQFYWLGHDVIRQRLLIRDGATAAFSHPNSLAGYLTIVVPCVFSLCFSPGLKVRLRLALMSLWSIMSWALILTFSRSGIFAGLAGVLFFICHKSKPVFIWICILAVLLAGSFLRFAPHEVRKRTRTRPEIVSDDVKWRWHLWQDSLALVRERPWVGHGLNTYMDLIHRKRPDAAPVYAHNCYVQIMVETGVLGLAGFLWILFALGKAVFGSLSSPTDRVADRRLSGLILGLYSGVVAFLVHSFFEVHFYSLQLSVYFWLIAGILISGISMQTHYKKCEENIII